MTVSGIKYSPIPNKDIWVLGTYHRGVEARPARPVHRSTLVSRDFAGRDEELNLVWVGGHLHVRKSLGPSRGADQPHEGEDDGHHKVLENRNTRTPSEDGEGQATATYVTTALTMSGPRLFSRYLF